MIIILFSVFENIEFTTFSKSIGFSYYSLNEQASSLNPALTGIEKYSLAFDYMKLYSVADMGRIYASFRNIGISIFYRKIEELQNEGIFSLSYGLRLNDDARIGFNLKGFYLYQKEFNSDYTFGFDIGFHTKLWRLWSIGFVISNINKPSFGINNTYEIEPKFGFGVSYSPSQYLESSFGFEKEMGKDVRFLFGNILKLSDYLILQAGLHSSPYEPTFGIKIATKFVSFNFAFIYNNELPSNYSIGVEIK
uniref:Type IX secretion system membrane protein PorP/SprF n=1 Tax=candidate division WOR-3 bacterium TaxID=2052148 RepID=A0A7C4YFU5_UNCW3